MRDIPTLISKYCSPSNKWMKGFIKEHAFVGTLKSKESIVKKESNTVATIMMIK